MKFKYYDVFSHLVPGYLIYQILIFLYEDLPDIEVLPSIAIAFILGYFVNTIGSWLENFYRYFYRGKPSMNLLKGKDIAKVKFYRSKEVRELIKNECKDENPSEEKLFSIAISYANQSDNSRVSDFNASYALSRSFLTGLLIIFTLLVVELYASVWVYLVMIPLIFITWRRLMERDYYYAREVLFTYLNKTKQ